MKNASLRNLITTASLAALLLGAAACKTSQSTGPEAPQAAAGTGAIDWKAMDGDQKKKHMKEVVMPTMRKVFAGLDAARYGEAKCVLCHGEGEKEGTFHMPNPDLPAFSTDMFDESPEMATFMKDQVVPALAAALNLKPQDMATNTGDVGCMTCHPAQE